MEELRDKNPFHCIITGPTNCGKTRYVIDQLRGSFRHVFDWIVLICPTYSKNKTYRGFAKGDKRFVVLSPDASNVEEINDLLGICEDFFSGTNTLIILDDCAVVKYVFKVLLLVYKALNGMAPPYLSDMLCYRSYSRSLRSASQKLLVVHRTNMKTYGDRAFSIAGPKLWNQLPLSIRELSSIDSFKKSLKTYLFRLAYS